MRQQRFFFVCMMVLFVIVACQGSGNPVPALATKTKQPEDVHPFVTFSAPTVSAENEMRTMFPSFSITDPDTVCIQHFPPEALSCLDATGWHIYKDEYAGLSIHPPSTIPDEIFGCSDGRIYLVDDGFYLVEGEALVDIGGSYSGNIACGGGNELWLSDYSEIRRFDGSDWTSYPVEEYFESHDDEFTDSVYSLAVAPNGNVWVTMNRTIATFDGSKWEILTPPGNPYFMDFGGLVQGLAIDSNGTVWAVFYPEECCTNNQLLKYDGIQWTTFPVPEDEYHGVRFIAADSENRIWAALGRSKIYTFDPKTNEWDFRFDMQQVGLGKGGEYAISAMEFDGQGRLWVTTDYGLGIYDGSTWTTYHIHTANLYIPADPSHMNNIGGLFILGDGPPLPAPEVKAPGSVRGRLVSRNSNPFTGAQVEVCLRPTDIQKSGDLSGDSPCAHQAYHALADVNTDGSFMIPNVPIGSYYLMIKLSYTWAPMVHSGYIDVFMLEDAVNFIVNPGTETQLGDISTP